MKPTAVRRRFPSHRSPTRQVAAPVPTRVVSQKHLNGDHGPPGELRVKVPAPLPRVSDGIGRPNNDYDAPVWGAMRGLDPLPLHPVEWVLNGNRANKSAGDGGSRELGRVLGLSGSPGGALFSSVSKGGVWASPLRTVAV